MELPKLIEQMRRTALKMPHRLESEPTIKFKAAPEECCQQVSVNGKRYDVMYTLNLLEDVAKGFWQLTISDVSQEGQPPSEIVGYLVKNFLGDDASDIMEITHLLPSEAKPQYCRQFVRRYDGTIFESVFGGSQHAKDLSPDDEMRKYADKAEKWFTAMVAFLRNPLDIPQPAWPKTPGRAKPHKVINDLCRLFYDLVGSRVTATTITPSVKSLHFWTEIKENKDFMKSPRKLAVVMCPMEFADMVQEDLHMQMGGIVFCASKARDYWNNQFTCQEDSKTVMERAYAHEAEYLHTLVGLKDFDPNEYQKKVMRDYPKGVLSLPLSICYESRDFDIRRARAEFLDVAHL